jgi:hypothetical protein
MGHIFNGPFFAGCVIKLSETVLAYLEVVKQAFIHAMCRVVNFY